MRFCWIAVACYLLLSGCGQKPPATAPVHGKVAVGGKPVAVGLVAFYPDDGSRPAIGSIQPDGTYRLTTFRNGDGAIVGTYRVTIEASESAKKMPEPATFEEELRKNSPRQMAAAGAARLRWIVPEKYARRETTPLTADVKPGDNTLDFDVR